MTVDSDRDPDKLKSPGGMTPRQIHEQGENPSSGDREAPATHNSPAPKSRWQR